MKKIIFLALFIATIFQSSQAQVSIGGIAGMNYSKLLIDHDIPEINLKQPEMDKGYYVGISSDLMISETIHLLGDLKYTAKGYRNLNPDQSLNVKYAVNYLEVAPKIEFRLREFIGIAIGVNFGIYGGARFREGNGDWQKTQDEIFPMNSNVALTGSVRGYLKNFFLEAGYERGLKSLNEYSITDANGEPMGDVNWYIHNFNLGIGYLFAL